MTSCDVLFVANGYALIVVAGLKYNVPDEAIEYDQDLHAYFVDRGYLIDAYLFSV